MTRPADTATQLAHYKQQAAERAVDFVQSGMVVGLGTGSSAIFAVRRLAALLRAGTLRDVVGIPTSLATDVAARALGIPLLAADGSRDADLTIDGADEVDPALDLIKGGGGALLREKIVAQVSGRVIIVVDHTKLSPVLGTAFALPVEVCDFGWRSQERFLQSLGARVSRRLGADGQPYVTEHGNFILDCAFGPIAHVPELAARLDARAGVVEHGLFVQLATDLIVAGPGGVEHRARGPTSHGVHQ